MRRGGDEIYTNDKSEAEPHEHGGGCSCGEGGVTDQDDKPTRLEERLEKAADVIGDHEWLRWLMIIAGVTLVSALTFALVWWLARTVMKLFA